MDIPLQPSFAKRLPFVLQVGRFSAYEVIGSEERRHRMVPVVLHMANAATARAIRPSNGMVPGLRGDDLLLNTRQPPLCFSQGQSQIGEIDEIIGPIDLHDVRARPFALSLDFTNLKIQATHPPSVREQT